MDSGIPFIKSWIIELPANLLYGILSEFWTEDQINAERPGEPALWHFVRDFVPLCLEWKKKDRVVCQ